MLTALTLTTNHCVRLSIPERPVLGLNFRRDILHLHLADERTTRSNDGVGVDDETATTYHILLVARHTARDSEGAAVDLTLHHTATDMELNALKETVLEDVVERCQKLRHWSKYVFRH